MINKLVIKTQEPELPNIEHYRQVINCISTVIKIDKTKKYPYYIRFSNPNAYGMPSMIDTPQNLVSLNDI